ncbi:hypothetical protein [Flavobacterium geliluteum]|uniref:Uncharacterized protein n=1 Tax=Flavobacterium geliluteum TaxID=2816120 RepID=A0A941B2F8_9FLAO|nr:hypothetical protein [Flavobacterium geliluteum]MBP4137428.1 hypothetical protein [Flavobacterium geliluteum]
MSVTIQPITDHEVYTVNGKTVYKNTISEWTCNCEMTTTEKNAFKNYEKAVINNPAFKKHTKSTYKTK